MNVDRDRLREDIETNARFGAEDVEEGRGRTTLTATEADREARERFLDRLRDAGLDVRIDGIGNVAGRWTPPSADPDAAPVAAGSHLDSVPMGGIFDGPLGTYAALEAVRAMQEGGLEPARPVDVVSWTEEEGVRFGTGLLGSSVATGERPVGAALDLTDDEGNRLGDELDAIGFRGDDEIDPSSWAAWFELHVEQNTVLEEAGVPVGVVDAISGISNCRVRFAGEADHAGGTPMYDRRDALVAASEFIVANERAAREAVATGSEGAVSTVGKLDVSPNANNVVPGEVELTVDVRDVDRATMDRMVERGREAAARIARDRPVEATFERYRLTEPSDMAERCVTAALDAADRFGIEAKRMQSAALHDTANLAGVTDTAMLFAPSRDGISHNPLEWTDWDDCATAARVMAGAMAALATE
ncbi:MAG: M20 family metallo-hydrolase [Haloarculaceae archaeon]